MQLPWILSAPGTVWLLNRGTNPTPGAIPHASLDRHSLRTARPPHMIDTDETGEHVGKSLNRLDPGSLRSSPEGSSTCLIGKLGTRRQPVALGRQGAQNSLEPQAFPNSVSDQPACCPLKRLKQRRSHIHTVISASSGCSANCDRQLKLWGHISLFHPGSGKPRRLRQAK